MAVYNTSFKQLIEGSSEDWVDDVIVDRAVNGATKVRAFFTAKKRAFTVRHVLGATDRGTLQTFYDTNRALSVTFTWNGDGQTYTCLFDGPPKVHNLGGSLTQIDVKLVEQ